MASLSPVRGSPAACTIVSRNYLSFARVLAKSYLEFEPTGRFYLLVIDGLPEGVEAGADVQLILPSDLNIPTFDTMTFTYDVAELCTAVKPTLLLALFNYFREEHVLFLDPDIMLLRPLSELKALMGEATIVFTPNLLEPIPFDGRRPTDQDIFLSGTCNLGFVGLTRSAEALDFLTWWEGHLLHGDALVSVPDALMTDQKWMDLAPSLYAGTRFLRDDTYNVAWWNLHHRSVSRNNQQYLVNGRPIAFFHFSGFDPSNPLGYTKENQTRTRVEQGSALAKLLQQYARLHEENGYAEIKHWHCSYAHFEDGVFINLPLRRLYLRLGPRERALFGNPFEVGRSSCFRAWATEPDPDLGNLSPFLRSLYEVRYDMWPRYPDVRGNRDDRDGFLEWVRVDGGRELKFDPKVMRVDEAGKVA
jgi:hypothetical protein